ncbi:hypothetical protein JCM10207_007085 [Rhodosporidiobolus poonsookiae]
MMQTGCAPLKAASRPTTVVLPRVSDSRGPTSPILDEIEAFCALAPSTSASRVSLFRRRSLDNLLEDGEIPEQPVAPNKTARKRPSPPRKRFSATRVPSGPRGRDDRWAPVTTSRQYSPASRRYALDEPAVRRFLKPHIPALRTAPPKKRLLDRVNIRADSPEPKLSPPPKSRLSAEKKASADQPAAKKHKSTRAEPARHEAQASLISSRLSYLARMQFKDHADWSEPDLPYASPPPRPAQRLPPHSQSRSLTPATVLLSTNDPEPAPPISEALTFNLEAFLTAFLPSHLASLATQALSKAQVDSFESLSNVLCLSTATSDAFFDLLAERKQLSGLEVACARKAIQLAGTALESED